MRKHVLIVLGIIVLIGIGVVTWLAWPDTARLSVDQVAGARPTIETPREQTIPTVDVFRPIGWGANGAPVAAQGLAVNRFAQGLDHPRIMYPLPNGDILVAESNAPDRIIAGGGLVNLVAGFLFARAGADKPSPNKLVLLRDANGDGVAETRAVLRSDLHSPGGMAWANGKLYVANTDAVLSYDYKLGDTTLGGTPAKLMDLPGAGNHWMRNLVLSPDGSKLYVGVGSASNIGEGGMD